MARAPRRWPADARAPRAVVRGGRVGLHGPGLVAAFGVVGPGVGQRFRGRVGRRAARSARTATTKRRRVSAGQSASARWCSSASHSQYLKSSRHSATSRTARRRAGLPTFALSQSRSSTSRGLAQGRDSPQSGGAPQYRLLLGLDSCFQSLRPGRRRALGAHPGRRPRRGRRFFLVYGCASTRRSSWLARASRRWRRSSCRASRRRHCSTASR